LWPHILRALSNVSWSVLLDLLTQKTTCAHSHQEEFILFFYCFIIHMCIQGLGHFSPLTPPPPLPHTPSIPSRNYFALISNFVEERVWAIIGRNKGFCWLR
jgi:hypothetical protein